MKSESRVCGWASEVSGAYANGIQLEPQPPVCCPCGPVPVTDRLRVRSTSTSDRLVISSASSIHAGFQTFCAEFVPSELVTGRVITPN